MAFDAGLVERIRHELRDQPGMGEIRMFGGVCFTLNGNMMAGVVKDELMLRVGVAAYEEALRHKHAREMDFTKRPLNGYVYVAAEGIDDDRDLSAWLARARHFVSTLPPKLRKAPTPKMGGDKLAVRKPAAKKPAAKKMKLKIIGS